MVAAHRSEHRHSCCSAETSDDLSAKPGSHLPTQSQSNHAHGQSTHGQHAHESHLKESGSQSPAAQNAARDPVCGMTVDPHATPHRGQHAGRTYYFCSKGCAAKFASDPEKYLTKDEAKPPQPVPEGTIYTCPMHPQIRQIGPGSCPICGMALEPELVSAEAAPNVELIDMTRRFWVALVLALPVFALEMGGHLTNLHMLLGQTASNWLQFAFATPVVLWAGWPFFVRGWQSLVTRNLNMFTLIAMGVGVAYLYSVVAVLAPEIFPLAFRTGEGAVAVYFEAAAVITVLVLLGQVLELRAREQTSGAIRALLDLRPRRRAARRRTEPTRRSPSTPSWSATVCACVPAKRCRWTARWSRDALPLMSRW